ncbi:MAG: BamA/TamA family outer membrane protein [Candidatus Marinimicrobia bacterium]|nr:BamA/TamA family outer membrane protein [Candidatus Neomarinimicrobiota bacterium]
MHISRIILFMVLVLHGQTVELIVHEEKYPTIMAAQMVEMYLDSLLTTEETLNHSYVLASFQGEAPTRVAYTKIEEAIAIDTIIISGNNEISENTAFTLLAPIMHSIPRLETMQQVGWIESSYKFFQNSIGFVYARTQNGHLAALVKVIPAFESNFSGILGTSQGTGGIWKTTGEIDIHLENIWQSASTSHLHWQRQNEKSQVLSFYHEEPAPLGIPFGLRIKFDQELTGGEYVYSAQEGTILTSGTRYGKWRFGGIRTNINPTETGASIGLSKHKSSAISVGLEKDSRNNRWTPFDGNYWDVAATLGNQTEDNKKDLQGHWLISIGSYWPITSQLSAHTRLLSTGRWVQDGAIHKGQKIRYGGINGLRGYRDDQFISNSILIPTIELLATAGNNLQLFGFIEGSIQKEYQPYPIGFGFGSTKVSISSILSVTIGFGRDDPLSAAKLHIKFSSRL